MMAESQSGFNGFKWQYLTIGLWITLLIATASGSRLLSDNIESATGFLDVGTESGRGSLLYEDRFNITGDVGHIIVLHLPDDNSETMTSKKWRQYSFALTMYVNDSLVTQKGLLYDTFISEAMIFLFTGSEVAGESMISEDGKVGLINIFSSFYQFDLDQAEVADHVHMIRDLLTDTEKFYTWASNIENVPRVFGDLPTLTEINDMDRILTGAVANFVDTIEITEQSFRDSEVISVILIVIVLAFVFRSPMGIVIPIIGMIVSLTPTFMLAFLLGKAGLFQISDFLPSMISMIGIAVAVDYNLFSLVRFREEFRKRKAKHILAGTWDKTNIKITQVESAKVMNSTAGQAVMYSGITVIIGFMSMLVIGSDFSKSMSISISIMVIFSILSARTLTPAILGIWGQKLDWPNKLSGGDNAVEKEKNKLEKKIPGKTMWEKWSDIVLKFPILFLLLGLLILTPFIILSASTELSFDTLKSLPPGTESREGLEYIQNEFSLGDIYPYQVLIDAGEGNSVIQPQIIAASNLFAQWANDYDEKFDGTQIDFTNINSLTFNLNSSGDLNTMTYDQIDEILNSNNDTIVESFKGVTSRFVNYEYGSNLLVINVGTNLDPGTALAWDLTKVIRDQLSIIFDNVDGVEDTYVTGFSASFLDTNESLYSDVPLMILVAVVLIYLALLILFRSIILPIKAILTIGGSILFGLGTLVYVLQEGNILHVEIFGIILWEAEQSGVAFIIPIFLFTTILGLGMDYSIFIITRINEEYLKNGKDINAAIGVGLSKTAGVITAAATVMTTTFLVFAASPTLIMKSIGLALSVSIIVDATISRVILLPALMRLTGRWNWWLPGWLDKILPRIKMNH